MNQQTFKFVLGSTLMIQSWGTCLMAEESSTVPRPEERPNIVWIVSEDNSAAFMRLFHPQGIETPAIEALASRGITYENCYSNAPVSSAARSTLITGAYAPQAAAHYHRAAVKSELPSDWKMYPQLLQEAGYYTANNAKEDYNWVKPKGAWNMSSRKATWKNRKPRQPFMYVYNMGTTHEGKVLFTEADKARYTLKHKPEDCYVPGNMPQTPLSRYTAAYYADKIAEMDKQVGDVVAKLRKDNLLDNTFIFYFGDNGGVLPNSKGYLSELGVHVPLVVAVPEKFKHLAPSPAGSKEKGIIEFVDLTATILNLAGVKAPKYLDGQAFLGKGVTADMVAANDTTYSYCDRLGERSDMVRAVRIGQYKYKRNFQPYSPEGLENNYRYGQLAFQEWRRLFREGKLSPEDAAFYLPKAPEQLFDLSVDPDEKHDLAQDPAYKKVLKKMRHAMTTWQDGMPDLSFIPEVALIERGAMKNPIAYGQAHKKDIKRYRKITNLQLLPWRKAVKPLRKLLTDKDPVARYWALMSASGFGQTAAELQADVQELLKQEQVWWVKMRAYEYLTIACKLSFTKELEAMQASRTEEWEQKFVANTIRLLEDLEYTYEPDFTEILPKKYDKSKIVQFDDYMIWGTNILKGKDGKYHAIYSRWPQSRGHLAWVTHSEIAHAVADSLTGPYVFKNVVLPARGPKYWDGDVTHNPHVLYHKGKYYLYHMGNKGSGYWKNTPDDHYPLPKDKEWWVNRNNQRVGVAVADNLNGPWKRFKKPLIDIDGGPDRMMTSTPVVSVRKDGKFLMAYKYVCKDKRFKHGKVVHVTALSDSPTGPFKETGKPFITHPTSSFALDDHVEWWQGDKYYCIAKDSRGNNKNYPAGSLLLYTAGQDGMNWKLAKHPLVMEAGAVHWTDGTSTPCKRIGDMPKLVIENNKVVAIVFASLPQDTDDSFVRIVPLK